MARRAIAVSLVCLFVLGGVPGRAGARAGGCAASRAFRAAGRPVEPYAPGPGETSRMMADLRRRLDALPALRRAAEFGITVPVWVHVIREGRQGARDGAVRRQIAMLNMAYGGRLGGLDTGVRFRIVGVTHTNSQSWFRDPLGFELPLKTHLRRGGPGTLNLYIAQLSELVLGYSTYPYRYAESPVLDGVVIDWRTLPGGALKDFDRGLTGVHEIGHWLGLLHTFENGCETPGDYVDDTAPEGVATEGCPPGKDTCTAPGDDPVHNFMDYSHDRCMSTFSHGQAARMREMWDAYRRTPKV
jgi:hypothetical protein